MAVHPEGSADVGTRRGLALPLPPVIVETRGGVDGVSPGDCAGLELGLPLPVAGAVGAAGVVAGTPGALLLGEGTFGLGAETTPGVVMGAAGVTPMPAQPERTVAPRMLAARADPRLRVIAPG